MAYQRPSCDRPVSKSDESGPLPVSVVITVLNDKDGVTNLIKSIAAGNRHPEEVIVVDGGSTDGTVSALRELSATTHSFRIRSLFASKINIARGRNLGISAASHEIIVVTDSGCTVQPQWLEELVSPLLLDEAEVASGPWLPRAPSLKLKGIALSQFPRWPKESGARVPSPSSRNLAFLRTVWTSVGGYPEHLEIGEDTAFNSAWRKRFRYMFAPRAAVRWEPRAAFCLLFRQHFQYGLWDGIAKQNFLTYWKLGTFYLLTLVTPAYLVFKLEEYFLGAVVLILTLVPASHLRLNLRCLNESPRFLERMIGVLGQIFTDVGKLSGFATGIMTPPRNRARK